MNPIVRRTIWRLRHTQHMLFAVVPFAVITTLVFTNRYGASPDEAATAGALFVGLFYVLFRACFACMPVPSQPVQRPTFERRMVPMVGLIVAVAVLAFSAAAMFLSAPIAIALDMSNFASAFIELGLYAALGIVALLVVSLLYSLALVAWNHRHRVIGEIRGIFTTAEAEAHSGVRSKWAGL